MGFRFWFKWTFIFGMAFIAIPYEISYLIGAIDKNKQINQKTMAHYEQVCTKHNYNLKLHRTTHPLHPIYVCAGENGAMYDIDTLHGKDK